MIKTIAYGIPKDKKLIAINGSSSNSFGYAEFREIVLPEIAENEILVRNFAAGINYNSIWSALREPADPFSLLENYVRRNPHRRNHLTDFQVIGSDSAGVIEKVGKSVTGWKAGDEVVIHCNVVDPDSGYVGIDEVICPSQGIWGYETNFGAFAKHSIVVASQLLPRPSHLTWAESASYMLTLTTAYRMLLSSNGAGLQKNESVLIWGASGGLGHFASQLVNYVGGIPIGIVSSEEKMKKCKDLGLQLVINRSEVTRDLIDTDGHPNQLGWRSFEKHLRKVNPDPIDVVFEHVGRETLGLSIYLARPGGRIVTCAATSGYECTIDLRYLWMNSKRLIGSHISNSNEARLANELVRDKIIHPHVSMVEKFEELPKVIDAVFNGKVTGKAVVEFDH
jgi:crotonyl-CoA reductase